MKLPPRPVFPGAALLILLLGLAPFVRGQAPVAGSTKAADVVGLPESVPDPLEPLNQTMWASNKGLMTDVIKPTSRVALPTRLALSKLSAPRPAGAGQRLRVRLL